MTEWKTRAPGIMLIVVLLVGAGAGFSRQTRWPSGASAQAVEVSRLLWNLQQAHHTLEGRYFSSQDLERASGGSVADLVEAAGFADVRIQGGERGWSATFGASPARRFFVAGGEELTLFGRAGPGGSGEPPVVSDVLASGEAPGWTLVLREKPTALFNQRRR